MNDHPIEGLMITTMNSIKDMIDVNTIIGEPITAANNIVIIPVSKVIFGFAAGGSEFSDETIKEYTKKDKDEQIDYKLPFGGGAGAGVTINPVAFIVINNDNVKLIPVSHSSAIDKLLDYVPDLIEKVSGVMNKCLNDKKEEVKEILKNKREEKEEKENQKKENKKKEKTEEDSTKDEYDKVNKVRKVIVEKEIKKPEENDAEDVELDNDFWEDE